ncbi:MAG TPA: FG-GAP-like repeat-containing protein [Usitatibacter sp.]|nr:FG-GAP-like repeat-containing protein [Usitatibacter sp.]
MKRTFRLVLAAASLFGASGAYCAQHILVTGSASAKSVVAIADLSPLVLRSRAVALSLPALASAASDKAPTIRIAFFDDDAYDFAIASIEPTYSGGLAYVGYSARAPGMPMILVNNGGTIVANFAYPGKRLTLRGTPESGYVSREKVEFDLPEHPPGLENLVPPILPPVTSVPGGNGPTYVPPPAVQQDDGSTMDVMVIYSPAAAAAAGGVGVMNADVDAEVAATNTIYASSNVVQRLRLVYKGQMNYVERNMNADLGGIQNASDGFLDQVPILRELYHADFVSLWGVYPEACGLGYAMTNESSGFAGFAYNVVNVPACLGPGAYSWAHELGHNMGLMHDNFVDNESTVVTAEGTGTTTTITYAHGYVDLTNQFRTIMAYDNQCESSGEFCFRIPYFSNPAVSFNNSAWYGGAVLAATGNATTANEHQALNDTRETTANFRASLASLTGAGIVSFLDPSYTVSEGAGSITLNVGRNVGSTGAISVAYSTASGTATSNVDFTATSGTLTWATGDTSNRIIVVPITQDSINEGPETFTVTLNTPTGGASVGSSGVTSQNMSVRILDDDPDSFPVGSSLPGTFLSPNVPNAHTTNSSWAVDPTNGFSSSSSLRSAQMFSNVTDFTAFGNSDMTYTADFVAGNVTFQYMYSGYQGGFSAFEFLVDNVVIPAASNENGGEVAWTAASAAITSGIHTLTWRFKNKLSFPCANANPAATGGAACADRAWVDNVSLPLAKRMDFDATGKTDLLWGNTDGRFAIWLMNGVSSTATQEIIGASSGWSVVHVADFNGDGKSDLVWQHTDGRMAIYLMNGTTPIQTTQLLNAGAWSVIGTPDLNGDGKADLLFENTDGTTAVWTMNGTTMTSGASIIGAGTGWHVTKTGDFDGDGNTDLLWTHTDGRVAIWLMNGAVVKATGQILNAGSGWSVAHVADLDGDGKADIVWQHTDGSVALWLMNGTAMATGSGLLGAGTGWSVARTADFDGDGKADLLFQHTDGRAAIYLMNGLVPKATQQILAAGGGWTATRTGDLNGDGNADIVWTNTDGRTAIWLMNGTSTLQTQGLGILTGWSVSPISQ